MRRHYRLRTNAFHFDVRLRSAIYRGLRRRYRLPACHLTALLAEDFAEAVGRNLRGAFRIEEGGAFDPLRVGGGVAAKHLDQSDDAARFVIVFDASLWTHADQPAIRASLIHLVAHEMSHPVIERARHIAGVMDGVPRPSVVRPQRSLGALTETATTNDVTRRRLPCRPRRLRLRRNQCVKSGSGGVGIASRSGRRSIPAGTNPCPRTMCPTIVFRSSA